MAEWHPIQAPILSPSAIATFNQCPLRFKYTKIDKRDEPQGEDATVGSFVHNILERLFQEKPENRTEDVARTIARDLWEKTPTSGRRTEPWKDLAGEVAEDLKQFRWKAWWLVEEYFKMEDPTEIEPTDLEVWVDGDIAGIRVRGIIDRRIADNGKLVIQDYKTGKPPQGDRFEAERIFPLMIYANLTEQETGKEVDRMELLYLSDGSRWTYEPTPENRETMLATVKTTHEAIVDACTTGIFPANKSRLCDWCHFKPECPAWNQ